MVLIAHSLLPDFSPHAKLFSSCLTSSCEPHHQLPDLDRPHPFTMEDLPIDVLETAQMEFYRTSAL
jgi:hypothetical protein